MRKIKFRAWDSVNEEMDYDFLINPNNGDALGTMYGEVVGYFPGHKLMQYTGLKDKNGKEIYEGDICWDERYQEYLNIVFSEGGFHATNQSIDYQLFERNDQIEVLGNIYENPNLLEGDQ